MKKSLTFLACMALCLPFVFSGENTDYYSYSYARLNYVKGDVFVQRSGDLGYEEGVVNLPLVEGDKLGTRDGRAEIHLGRKNYIRINNNTQIDFADLPDRGDDLISIHLLDGGIYLRINDLMMEKGIEIHTPDGSFYVLDEGLYRMEVSSSRNTEIYVLEGEMEAAGEKGSIAVRGGERLVAENGYFQNMEDYSYRNDESFADWNRSRESFHNRSVYRKYLPDDLYEYEAELAYYGRWTYESSYGYVWVPNVYSNSWRPYYNGRWVWYPIIGWTWVSYEPWGWCVSHYGRWHWRGGLGWYWIPQRHWGPAWVHWYRGYDYVGWAPLSYWNRPVVIINNHFYGRYNNGYYPYNSRALTVVRKNQLQARRISNVALSRNNVSRLGKISLSGRQPSVRHVSNADRVVSAKASKVLSRSNTRNVNKSFVSRKKLGSTRSMSRSRSTTLNRSGIANYKRSSSSRNLKGTVSKSSSGSRVKQYSSNRATSSRSGARNLKGTSARSSSSFVKRYSSNSARSSSSSKNLSSRSSSARSNTPRSSSSRSYSAPSRSSRSSSSRYTSPSRSSSSSVKRYSSNSARSSSSSRYSSSRSSSASSYAPRSSSSRSYSAPSRNSSSRSSSIRSNTPRSSSSRSYSAPSRSRNSSSSRVSRSSSRSSSRSYSAPSRSRSSSSSRVSRSSSSRSSRSSSSSSSRSSSRSSSSRSRKK